jgi:uncharacterized protein
MTLMTTATERLRRKIEIPTELLISILKVIQPEKIICFGVRSSTSDAWSCFLADSQTKNSAIYDLLIATSPCEQRPRHELLNIVDNVNTDTIGVNALIHNVIAINEAITGGNVFFTRICNDGIVIYDRQMISIKQQRDGSFSKRIVPESDRLWSKWFHLAQNFLIGAVTSFRRGCVDLAAFMLHQALEHTCIALTISITGYRPNTHNLGRLLTMTENFAPHSPTVFPRNTNEEKHLFRLLSRAYLDARYTESYEVTRNEMSILIERVSAYQRHAETLYHENNKLSINPSNRKDITL